MELERDPVKYLEFINHLRTKEQNPRAVKGPRDPLFQPCMAHMGKRGLEEAGVLPAAHVVVGRYPSIQPQWQSSFHGT